jgi:hypothetical protein
MILGGAFLAYLLSICTYLVIRSGSWLFAIIPATVCLLGVLWIVVGILSLARRSQGAIIIEDTGITLPQGNLFRSRAGLLIPRAVIATVTKHESIKGRLIDITLTTGEKIPVQARHYCELKTFLDHCKAHALPTI